MADIMIVTHNLTKQYNGKTVVNSVNLEIERGAIVGLVGQNGAGKTTLIRMLTGLVQPTSGSFSLLNGAVRRDNDVAAIVERPSIYTNLSAMDNLIAQCQLLGITADKEYLAKTLALVGLEDAPKKPAKNFSLGMKQRLAIAMTLVGRPQLLLLDEPTNGLDPQGIFDMREVFVNLNRELGVTILVSSHILSELGKFATEFYIMDKGKILERVTAEQLREVASKRVRLKVDDVDKTTEALKQYGKITVTDGDVDLYADVPITQIMLTLAKEGVNVLSIQQTADELEEYYINLIKRERQAKIELSKGGKPL